MEENAPTNRPLTSDERQLTRWMLEHGGPDAVPFLDQLELARVTPWRCPCGCASINFVVDGYPPAPPGVHVLADFWFGEENDPYGVFVFENDGILSGLEVWGMAGDAPKSLPSIDSLHPFPCATKPPTDLG